MNIHWIQSLCLVVALSCGFQPDACFATTTATTPPIRSLPAVKVESTTEAIHRLDKWIREDPDDALLYVNRAELFNSMGQYDEALHDSDKALQLSSQSVEAHKQRALALSGVKKWPDALDDADQYVERAPHSELALAYEMRGCIELRAEKFAAAIVDFNSAIQLNHDYAWLYLFRARAFNGFGVYDRAVKDCTKCLVLAKDPRNAYDWRCEALALAARSQANEKLGQHDLAQQDMRHYSELLKQHK